MSLERSKIRSRFESRITNGAPRSTNQRRFLARLPKFRHGAFSSGKHSRMWCFSFGFIPLQYTFNVRSLPFDNTSPSHKMSIAPASLKHITAMSFEFAPLSTSQASRSMRLLLARLPTKPPMPGMDLPDVTTKTVPNAVQQKIEITYKNKQKLVLDHIASKTRLSDLVKKVRCAFREAERNLSACREKRADFTLPCHWNCCPIGA